MIYKSIGTVESGSSKPGSKRNVLNKNLKPYGLHSTPD